MEPEKPLPPKDHDSFVRLLMRHDRTVRAFLRSLLPTANDVDEVMQEVSVIAWRKFADLDAPENFTKWICVIARYEVLMYRRKKARDRFVLSEQVESLIADEGLNEIDLRHQQLAALESCVNKLSEQRKQLVHGAYHSSGNLKSLAKKIGRKPDAVYKMLSRTKRTLLECVQRALAENS